MSVVDKMHDTPLVTEHEIDHAILESDRVEGTWNDHVLFDTDNFDYGGDSMDDQYLQKVHNLLTVETDILENLTEKLRSYFTSGNGITQCKQGKF